MDLHFGFWVQFSGPSLRSHPSSWILGSVGSASDLKKNDSYKKNFDPNGSRIFILSNDRNVTQAMVSVSRDTSNGQNFQDTTLSTVSVTLKLTTDVKNNFTIPIDRAFQ